MALSEKLLQGFNALEFTEMTPVQREAIPHFLEKKDILVQAPTGTGKTCAFGVPLLEAVEEGNHKIQALILCPTRELVLQTTEVLKKLSQFMPGIKIASVYGGERIDKQAALLRRKPSIVVATPGRAMDFLQRRVLKLAHLKCVVLDEADRMLDMGFRDDMHMILEATPSERQTVLFSATMNKEVIRIATEYQQEAVNVTIKQETATTAQVSQFYIRTERGAKIPTLTALLQENLFSSSIVFAGTKAMSDTIADQLTQMGYRAAALHGDLRQKQRDLVMGQYRKGTLDVLVATDVAARGIDVSNVDAVINFDIPQNAESYVHRIGRTGRAQKTGTAYTFVYAKELPKLRDIMTSTKADIQPVNIQISSAAKALASKQKQKSQEKAAAPAPFSPKRRERREEETALSMDRARLFISLGTLDKVSRKNMVDLICTECNVPAKQIGTISVFNSYSFFDVPASYVPQIRNGFKGKSYNKRSITVDLSKKPTRSGRPAKRQVSA